MSRRLFLSVLLLFVLACDQTFNPKGEFEPVLAVYAVLSTDNNQALIRIVHTYDPPGFNPLEFAEDPSLTDATVSIFKEDSVYSARDTTLGRTDTSRYGASIKAYVVDPFPVEFGKQYSLTIQSPTYGTYTSSMVMPALGAIILANPEVLNEPKTFKNDSIFAYVGIVAITRGYLLRAFLEFDRVENSQLVVRRAEVPILYQPITSDPVLPRVQRRVTPEGKRGLESTPQTLFQVQAFLKTADMVHADYPNSTIRRAIFVLNQIDPNFYTYYSIVNGFEDEYSIRIDEPGFTNIVGGEGVFGGFTVEELAYVLPLSEYN